MTSLDSTLVVIPAYNEEATVATVVRGVVASGLDVLVVDDGSHDRTKAEAQGGGAIVLSLPFNLGVGGALRCGFRWAVNSGYDTVVQCDADGQHDPLELHRLIEAAQAADAHLVVGSRFVDGEGFQATRLRRIPMRLLSSVASKAAGVSLTDATSGFRVIREPLLSEFARAYPVHYLGDTFEVLVQAGRCGYRVREVGVTMHPRAGGVPSAGTSASMRFLARSLFALLIGSSHDYPPFVAGNR
ncbi:MAG: glycosyltransferase family 2 protein [Actinomycetota bacterium]